MSNNLFLNAAEQLRDLADVMQRYSTEPLPPEACGDLGSAARRLRQLGLKTSCIHLDFWVSGISKESAIEWRVWDGSEHHKGKTLDMAMRICEAAHAQHPDPEIAAAEALTPPVFVESPAPV